LVEAIDQRPVILAANRKAPAASAAQPDASLGLTQDQRNEINEWGRSVVRAASGDTYDRWNLAINLDHKLEDTDGLDKVMATAKGRAEVAGILKGLIPAPGEGGQGPDEVRERLSQAFLDVAMRRVADQMDRKLIHPEFVQHIEPIGALVDMAVRFSNAEYRSGTDAKNAAFAHLDTRFDEVGREQMALGNSLHHVNMAPILAQAFDKLQAGPK
jgi:hypothetical protein